jgi:hypothetical protein
VEGTGGEHNFIMKIQRRMRADGRTRS